MEKAGAGGWPLVGNRQITQYLDNVIARGKMQGAFIFAGPEDLGKSTLARYVARVLLCQAPKRRENNAPCGSCDACRMTERRPLAGTAEKEARSPTTLASAHSDFFLLKRPAGKKEIPISLARIFIANVSQSSFFNSYKVGIIKQAEHLTREAANALLKTLEEPLGRTVIILTCSSLDALPATIVSRSQLLRFSAVPADEIYDFLVTTYGSNRNAAKLLSRLSLGRPALAIKFFENGKFLATYSQDAENFISCLEAPIYQRMASLSASLSRADDPNSPRSALRLIGIYASVLRDGLLAFCGHTDLMRHQEARSQIERWARRQSLASIAQACRLTEESRDLIQANVSPQNVIEHLAINLP